MFSIVICISDNKSKCIHVFYCKVNHKNTPGNKIPGVY